MYKILLVCLFQTVFLSLYGQKTSFNTTLLSHFPLNEDGNDVWGYTDKSGVKYAIIGGLRNTWVFSLEDPANPVLRYKAPGAQSTWRDIKSFQDHLYVTTDRGTDGLVIIDMTKAPDTISHLYYQPVLTVGTVTKPLERCHNIYIDEKGYAYLAGCNISRGGVLIFDLNTELKAPEYVGAADLEYSHDAYARGDTLYTSEIYLGAFGVYDISDRSEPKLMARQNTSRNFTHNTWLSEDGNYLFTTDERSNAFVDAYDISDLENIRLLDKYRPLETENTGTIPHNTHYHNGYLAISWYTDGLRIVDAHRPDNLVEVAYYDTWNDPSRCHAGFFGCWGAFPFTGSDIVYASDINNGLFIVNVDYKRACYLEGTIRDSNGAAIPNAKIEIIDDQMNRKFSDPSGYFKTGIASSGTFEVRITHPDFHTGIYTVILNNGEVTSLDAVLFKRRPLQFSLKTTNKDFNPVEATARLLNDSQDYVIGTNSNGVAVRSVLSGTYTLYLSSWGYKSIKIENFNLEDESTFSEFEFEKGYEDQFNMNTGWTVESTPNMTGSWVRAIPRGTDYFGKQAQTGMDDPDDFGPYCFVTGNGTPGAACDDVDNGTTIIRSPLMKLRGLKNPGLNYSYSLFRDGGASLPDDTLFIKLSNGTETVIVQKIGENTEGWEQTRDLKIEDYIALTDSMYLMVEISDLSSTPHIVEAAFDHFFINEEETPSSTTEISIIDHWNIYPNPGGDIIHLKATNLPSKGEGLMVTDMMGKIIYKGTVEGNHQQMNISQWHAGIYIFKFEGGASVKWVKI